MLLPTVIAACACDASRIAVADNAVETAPILRRRAILSASGPLFNLARPAARSYVDNASGQHVMQRMTLRVVPCMSCTIPCWLCAFSNFTLTKCKGKQQLLDAFVETSRKADGAVAHEKESWPGNESLFSVLISLNCRA
jgi:hypothetical protein